MGSTETQKKWFPSSCDEKGCEARQLLNTDGRSGRRYILSIIPNYSGALDGGFEALPSNPN